MRLSLAMIAKNEEPTLAHCLASVRDLVDEIVVVDTGSSDGTREVARGAGAILGDFPWVDDFAAARNASLDLCTGDWVLVLDADEAIDALDHDALRAACREEGPQAYRLTLRNYLKSGDQATLDAPATPNEGRYQEGRELPFYAEFQGLRLCRRLPGLVFQGRIHELLDPYFEARGLPIASHPAVIHHYGKFLEAREDFKRRYYLDLTLAEARQHPGSLQQQFNLLQQALAARDWTIMLEAAQACAKLQKKPHTLVGFGLGMALQGLGRYSEAILAFDRLLKVSPGHALALLYKGLSQARLERHDEARRSFRETLRIHPSFALAYANLAELEVVDGHPETARVVLDAGLSACPRDPKLHQQRVLLDLRLRDQAKAVQDAAAALQSCPSGGEGLWHQLVALELARSGDAPGARRVLAAGLDLFPTHEGLLRLNKLIIN
nr:glycosyltransferase [uncultured Holophaga sp.]